MALLNFLAAATGVEVGALVAYRSDRAPHAFGDGRLRIVFYHDPEMRHYQLLGDEHERLVYDSDTTLFRADLPGLRAR
jgi:hypothetical protein